jgi:hypothetical protein
LRSVSTGPGTGSLWLLAPGNMVPNALKSSANPGESSAAKPVWKVEASEVGSLTRRSTTHLKYVFLRGNGIESEGHQRSNVRVIARGVRLVCQEHQVLVHAESTHACAPQTRRIVPESALFSHTCQITGRHTHSERFMGTARAETVAAPSRKDRIVLERMVNRNVGMAE